MEEKEGHTRSHVCSYHDERVLMGGIPYAFRLWVSVGLELEFDGGGGMRHKTEKEGEKD